MFMLGYNADVFETGLKKQEFQLIRWPSVKTTSYEEPGNLVYLEELELERER